jgi:hypothetical protein
MEQQTRVREHIGAGGGAPAGADDAADSIMVTVSHWPYCERLPVGEMTVGEIRRRYADRFDIDPQSVATLDGNEADAETVVAAGQTLMFVRRAGEKG